MASRSDYFDLVDWEGGYGAFAEVHLYPNDQAVDENWVIDSNGSKQPVAQAVVDGLDQLVAANSIEWYEVWKLKDSEEFPEKNDGSKSSFTDGFRDYFNNHDRDYCNFTGLHYGIGGDFDGGGGGPAIGTKDETAFRSNPWMIIGSGSGNTDRVKSFAKQELLHAYTAYEELNDGPLMEDGSDDEFHEHMHEHDTGLVYTNGEVSPMAITYADTHARHAKCDNGRSDNLGYNPYYTSCSKEAVRKTAEAIWG